MDSQVKDNRIQPHLPIILTPPQEREDQSQRSLFRNDSLSSAEHQRYGHHSKQQPMLPQIDQIRKFLRKGDLLNTNTLKKLKQDVQINQIVKKDRSSASLYKVMHTIDFSGEKESKKAEIKRIYMSNRKQPAKLSLRHSFRKPTLASHQVQTDRIHYVQEQSPIQNNIEYNIQHLHKPSYVTIDIAQEEQMRTKTRMLPLEVQDDDQQNTLLPLRKSKVVTGRTKALSNQQNQLKSYLQKMGRTEFTFRSSLNKPKERYREYQQQQTIFSKTIDIKPLIPPKDFINTFNQVSTQPQIKVEPKNDKISLTPLNKAGPISQKGERNKNQTHSVGIQYQQMSSKEKRQINIPPQYSRQDASSLIPQHSEVQQPNLQTKSRIIYKQAEELINRVPTSFGNRRIFSNKVKNIQKSPKNKNKESILIQVPSLHQLKVGQQQGQQKMIHPIRQNFGRSELDWMQRIYNPKNESLRNLKLFEIKKYQNGVYYGQLSSQGLKHGKGVIFYFSGKIYEGEFISDMKHGKGHQYFPDGSIFRGEFRQGIKHGRGIYEWANGEVYDGQWQNGHKTGSGMWTNMEGESYMGQWKNDKVEGFGVFVMKNGSRYQGEFKNSLKHGVGTQRFYNGQTYVGSYQKNRPNGQGEYYWANGDYYKGSFLNGLRHGEGYFKEGKTGIQYRGEYQNDKKCGFGEINYNNGMVYVGNFQNNFRHGYGELLDSGKIKYKGYWVNDRQVDDQNQHIAPNHQAEKKKMKTNFKAIEQVLQRQQSLPKPLPRVNNRINQVRLSRKTHQHSISPSDKGEGYKRSCGCNKKH